MTVTEFNKCVDLYSDRIYRFVLKNMKQDADAQDVVQSTFEKMWIKRKEIGFGKAKSYLFSIAHNNMIDTIRKQKRINLQENWTGTEKTVTNEYTGLKDVINDALENIPGLQKNLIMLRDYEGYSYKEIGKITDLSESQVKVYIFRARKTLQQYFIKLDNII